VAVITKSKEREIIEDFAREIQQKRTTTVKPSKTIINFRTDMQDRNERTVYRVPIEILRYRKDNGRISSDVLDYETNVRPLDEREEESQKIIAGFLEKKDPEKTNILTKTIMHDGQRDPAIITCDGFLINGNRRKMVMEKLRREYPDDENYAYMKVVILPGKDEEGGPPTLLEIEKLENRYQLQSDGKAEYYNFDRALSIKRKLYMGLSLEEQLLDDPRYANASKGQLEKAIREYEKQYLKPLECVDRYLRQFRREGLYSTISTGQSDPEGRWQAFYDYSNTYSNYLQNQKKLYQLGIEEDEVGTIEEAAFDMIRLRTIKEMPKIHTVMRNLPKYLNTTEGKKEIMRIAEEVETSIPKDQYFDEKGNPLSSFEIDAKWAAQNQQPIIYHARKAARLYEDQKEQETPLQLLNDAYKKLIHEQMDIDTLPESHYKEALKLSEKIKNRADELKHKIYMLLKASK